eukprot:6210319-Pleurochrysis_carterae.AAC.1
MAIALAEREGDVYIGSYENTPDIQATNASKRQREALAVHTRRRAQRARAPEPTFGGGGLPQLTNGEKR